LEYPTNCLNTFGHPPGSLTSGASAYGSGFRPTACPRPRIKAQKIGIHLAEILKDPESRDYHHSSICPHQPQFSLRLTVINSDLPMILERKRKDDAREQKDYEWYYTGEGGTEVRKRGRRNGGTR
jgi:hypothetical protein